MMVSSGIRSIYEDMLTWDDWKLHLIAMFAEFVGTTSFLWLAFAAQTFAAIPFTSVAGNGNPNNPGNILYVALAFAFSYAINLWLFNPLSGGFFNPAATLALMIVEHLSLARGLLLIIIQFAAGITAAALVFAMFPFPLRASTLLNPACSLVQGIFIEAFLTTFLVFAIIALTVERTKTAILAPIGIGLSLFVAELAGVFWTGASLNPARSLGPAVVTDKFESYHWIYYVGPLIGLLLAVAVYELMKISGYRAYAADSFEQPMESSKVVMRRNSKGGSKDEYAPTERGSTDKGIGLSLV